jgi:transposase
MEMQQPKRLLKKLRNIRKKGICEIYFEDECHFQRTSTITRAWFLKGTTPEIKSPAVKEKISVIGAVGMDNGQLITMEANIFNASSFKKFIIKILKVAKTKKKILLVLDNARFHHAKVNKEFLLSVKKNIELVYLPPYSPDLNPIESFWKKTRRGVTHNRYFESLEEERKCLNKFFRKFRGPNETLMSLSANIKTFITIAF